MVTNRPQSDHSAWSKASCSLTAPAAKVQYCAPPLQQLCSSAGELLSEKNQQLANVSENNHAILQPTRLTLPGTGLQIQSGDFKSGERKKQCIKGCFKKDGDTQSNIKGTTLAMA